MGVGRVAAWVMVCFVVTVTASEPPEAYTFGLLEKLATTSSTIDALVPKLPESARARYTLAYDSASSQEGSPKEPRVVLYSPDLLVAFNGGHGAGGKTLEILRWVRSERRYEAREITEVAAPGGGTKLVMSAPNPERCLNCHGADPVPRFDRYADWKGFFGSGDDRLSDKESKDLDAFFENAGRNPRYAALVRTGKQPGAPYWRQPKDRKNVAMPNTRLTGVIAARIAERNQRYEEASGHFERVAPALLYAYTCTEATNYWTLDRLTDNSAEAVEEDRARQKAADEKAGRTWPHWRVANADAVAKAAAAYLGEDETTFLKKRTRRERIEALESLVYPTKDANGNPIRWTPSSEFGPERFATGLGTLTPRRRWMTFVLKKFPEFRSYHFETERPPDGYDEFLRETPEDELTLAPWLNTSTKLSSTIDFCETLAVVAAKELAKGPPKADPVAAKKSGENHR